MDQGFIAASVKTSADRAAKAARVTEHPGGIHVRLDPLEPSRRREYQTSLGPDGPWHPSVWRTRQAAAKHVLELVAWSMGRLGRGLGS